jgi:hypothetical protein
MKSRAIQQIRRGFRREWLLIAVDRLDPRTQVPITGRLLVHSPHRDEVYDAMLRRKGLTLVTYSEDRLPAGYATAF